MATAIRDGDAIFAKAITIASPEERAAYLAQACGEDEPLRHQIEDRLAAHFKGGHAAAAPATVAENGTPPPESGQARVPQPHHGQPAHASPAGKSSAAARGVTLLILGLAAACIGLTIWAVRTQGHVQQAEKKTEEAREHGKKLEEEMEQQREQAEAARSSVAVERDKAVERENASQDSLTDLKAVLAFFQTKVLSAGRPVGWSGGKGKGVTLRQAVDAAEARVRETLSDRPLAEAALRELFGATYMDLEEYALAVKEYERAMALREALQGEEHRDTVNCRNQLAVAYRLAGRPMDASLLYEPGTPSSTHAEAMVIRGVLLLSKDKPAEAEKVLRKSLAIRQKIQPEDWTTFESQSLLGEALREQKKYEEAEPLLQSGYEGLRKQEAKIPFGGSDRVARALARLVHLYDSWGKPEKAAPWRKLLDAARRKMP